MTIKTKIKLVYGVGINDASYPVYRTETVSGKSKIIWACPFYYTWKAMLRRCYSSSYHASWPTYIGCSVSAEWIRFSAFRRWMADQNYAGMQLDKDLLYKGNKIYSESSCVFIPPEINTFLLDCGAARGQYPTGVYFSKSEGKLAAYCRNPFSGKKEHIGYFSCDKMAHSAWKARKHQHALRYADMQSDPRISEALRKRFAA
jgi:hypothetical protein